MATRVTGNEKLKCGLCNAYIDQIKYRTHVIKCGKSDEEEEAQPILKVCPLCGKQVKDLAQHCRICTGGYSATNHTHENRQRSPVPSVAQELTTKLSNRTRTKECSVCSEAIIADDFEDHVENCGVKPSLKPPAKKNSKECPVCSEIIATDDFENHVDNCGVKPSRRPPTKKDSKECPVCSETISASDYEDHVDSCRTKPVWRPTTKKNSKECPVCLETISASDYEDHVGSCSPKPSRRPTTKKNTKECPVCSEIISASDYEDHVGSCSPKPSRRPTTKKNSKECPVCLETISASDYEDHVGSCSPKPSRRPTTKKNTKECPVCSEIISASDYEDHVGSCSPKPSRRPTTKKNSKECPVCLETISASDYEDHVGSCSPKPSRRPTTKKNSKECPVCLETISASDYEDHVGSCSPKPSRRPTTKKNDKECPVCSKTISVNDYEDHVDSCRTKPVWRPPTKKNRKECPVCSETISASDYEDHVGSCSPKPSRRPTTKKNSKECPVCSKTISTKDYQDHMDRCNDRPTPIATIMKNMEKCIICSEPIAVVDYERHVNACLESSARGGKTKPVAKPAAKSCFTCSSPVNVSKGSSHTIPCQARHIYCLKCLQRSMNEYIESNTVPVCHSTFCDYEFSRYDIECLPLEADLIKRLLPLVKSTKRPQCPFCLFYVDYNTMKDFEKHAASCTSTNLIPCEYCHCLYDMHRLDDHARQCRNGSRSQQQQALIDCILPKTKYPVTAQQIRIFLEHRKKARLPLDPHSVVDALAEFDGAFPFEIPTRDCDVCAESYVYDDIFVFGCEESHKLCYECFARSCTTKMDAKEIITCAMCAYRLQEGEFKQLRVPADQKKQFLEYQTQKLFGDYVHSTDRVIRCPNKECKWVAETQNPNDRFQVQCPMCGYEFCSLCSQQYHFRTTCQQIPDITQRWFFWCNTERGNYWQARAQQDANFRAQLEDYERQRAANTQRNEELQQRYNELLADETLKAQTCRLCPNCRRVVQHLSGCDLMVCGRNYHGGDQQSGCGHGFNWSQAPPYVPTGTTGPQQVRNDIPAPEQQKNVVHEGVQCDACHNEVQGIRFDCVHCASLIFCEKCEQRSTLEHSNQIRDQHKQQHVFRLITAA